MRIDVAEVGGRGAGIPDGVGHGPGGARTLLLGGGDVVRVGAHAEAGERADDVRTAGLGVLLGLEDEDGAPFAEDEAVPLGVVGA